MNKPMKCEAFRKLLDGYVDGALDDRAMARMDEHAKDCERCGETLEAARTLKETLAALDEGLTIPLDAQAAWRRAVRREAEAHGRPAGHTGALRAVGAIAAAFALVIGCTAFFRSQGALPLTGAAVGRYPASRMAAVSADNFALEEAAYDTVMPEAVSYADGGTALTGSVGRANMRLASDGAVESGAEDAAQDAAQPQGVVVLRSARREFETTAFDQSYQTLEDLVGEHGGYFETASVSGEAPGAGETRGRTASLTARVPSENLDVFLESIDVVGAATYRSESAEDISDRYYDRQGRLESCRAQLKRLNELASSAASLTELMDLEERTGEVQYEIEQLEGQIKAWDSRASYASVSLTLTEVAARDQVLPASVPLGERVKEGFYDSLNWLNGFWQDAAVVLAMIAPALVLIVPLVILIWVIVAAVRRSRRNRGK